MSKLIWTLSLAVVVAAGVGAAYYIQHRIVEVPVAAPPVVAESPSAPSVSRRDDEMQRRKLEGIGSTKDLKPVPIPQGNAR